jgi:hypothetical protein
VIFIKEKEVKWSLITILVMKWDNDKYSVATSVYLSLGDVSNERSFIMRDERVKSQPLD